MKHVDISRGRVWLVMMLLLVCGAAALRPPHVSGATVSQEQPFVTQVLRYDAPEAGEVALIWGVDDWQILPEAQRPAGTTIVKTTNDVMRTPMERVNGLFEVTLQAPAGTTINYVFHITRTRSGINAEAWDLNGKPERDFQTVVEMDGVTEVQSTIALGEELLASADDIRVQWISALVLAGITVLIIFAALRSRVGNPYLDY